VTANLFRKTFTSYDMRRPRLAQYHPEWYHYFVAPWKLLRATFH